MSTPSENLADAAFIAEKIGWFAALSIEEKIEHLKKNRTESFCTLPHPELGQITIGQKALERFWAMAKRFLASNPDKKARINFDEFVNALRLEYSIRFITDGRAIDQPNVDKLISAAYKRVERKFEELQHFIPVILFMTNTIPAFEVGPVTFLHKSEFFLRHQAELEAERGKIAKDNLARAAQLVLEGYPASSVSTEETATTLGNRLVDGLIETVREHTWISIVTIPPCDPSVSYEKALFLTKGALNILKLLLGGDYTDRLRTAEDQGHRTKGAKLYRRKNGELEISTSSTPQDNVVGSKWLDQLTTTHGVWFNMASDVLTASRDLDTAAPLCVRFVDSLAWYGDAIAERSNAAKIVKFVSAIERLVCTGKEYAVGKAIPLAEIVIPRAAVFYSQGFGVDVDEARKQFAQIYDWRSGIVHGSISPFDESLRSIAVKAEDATRLILLGGLDFFTSLGIGDQSFREKKLKEHYAELVTKAFPEANSGEKTPP
jgi:hypothetical protein